MVDKKALGHFSKLSTLSNHDFMNFAFFTRALSKYIIILVSKDTK